MNQRSTSRLCLLVAVLCPLDVFAVVPARVTRFQRILSFLPQVVSLFAAALLAILLWRKRAKIADHFRAKPTHSVVQLAAVVAMMVIIGAGLVRPGKSPRPSAPVPSDTKSQSRGPWLTFMGNGYRTGCAPGSGGPAIGRKLWTFQDESSRPFAASPAVSGDRVYVGSDSRKLYCLDAFTGQKIWEFEAAFEVFASPVVADGRVFVGEGLHYAETAKLYCLNADTGELVWSFATSSHIEFSPTLAGGKLYFGAGEDGVYCVDAQSGQKLWQYTGAHVDMSPVVTENGVLFGNVYGEPGFCCVSPADGKLRWSVSAPHGVCGSPSTDGERVYFGLGNGTFGMSHAQPKGAVWCLSVRDGRVIWRKDVGDAVLTTVALSRGAAYFGSRDGHLYCVDALSGDTRWACDTGEPVLSSPAVADGRVYFGSDDGCLRIVEAETGKELWQCDTSTVTFSADARVQSSPAVGNDRVYFGSLNSFFFCLGDDG